MFKKSTIAYQLLLLAAILSLIYSEVLFFEDNALQVIFIGLWVPFILLSSYSTQSSRRSDYNTIPLLRAIAK